LGWRAYGWRLQFFHLLLHHTGEYVAFQRDDAPLPAEHPHVDRRLVVPMVGVPFAVDGSVIFQQVFGKKAAKR